ncbi:hypothetical protein JAAARDRAFT_521210 [Jaapia argillacea MUCL 33604]|uniref:Protein kinase domain-containing protein n=1 Tax=Jaapia argillacea MUCL 33604 TaxID=933084 RepID=A0A067Q441_9AGAM|nr:hypothetical protein JAAARDRAFT_521210 [Jaapia argillacea MUCL 33604]
MAVVKKSDAVDDNRGRTSDQTSSSEQPSPGSWNVNRGRSRVRKPSNPFSEDNLKRRGYHSLLSSYGKIFHVEKRWKLIREMGSGAYGVVISAADEVSGEPVAIKQINRVLDKVQLAKRALREITLLRHFSNHENITGLIDVDAISHDFNDIYIFMEPMEADLHQIIKSGQSLTNEHVQYFLYQILRGMKYVHSASVVHRDLKPGNLLVNADCELKICDFGLARGFDQSPDENSTQMTEYVATRWYRAPELMLAFRRYDTAIDVWSIGCIFAELMLGKPLFKGKDYVDQLNKILEVLGSPDDKVVTRIANERAQNYVRSLPFKKAIPFRKLIPMADPQALDLLSRMLAFDPAQRIRVPEALEHPWLASYHDIDDEPDCPVKFEKWRWIEELETIDEFREALWDEIQDYRKEVRSMGYDLSGQPIRSTSRGASSSLGRQQQAEPVAPFSTSQISPTVPQPNTREYFPQVTEGSVSPEIGRDGPAATTTDPVVTYSRRSSLLQPRRNSSFASPYVRNQPLPSFAEDSTKTAEPGTMPPGSVGTNTVAFPSESYIVPARSRTLSQAAGVGTASRRLLRTLSTVSIYESVEGLPEELAHIGKYIKDANITDADAPASEGPRDFGFEKPHPPRRGNGEKKFRVG